MVENNILVRASDVSRCVECPLRAYIAYNESPQYDYCEKGTIWGSLEHNTRSLLMKNLRKQLRSEKAVNTCKPESNIDKVLHEVYHENPELVGYDPDLVTTTISNLRCRLLVEENARLARLKYLMLTMSLDEAIDASGIPIETEIHLQTSEQGFSGKVDAILKVNDLLIPLDHKSADIFQSYRRYDIQIGIYALLIESHFGLAVPYGIIYDTKRFQNIIIPITPELRNEIAEARKAQILIMQGIRPKGKPSLEQCKECPYRRSCPEKEGNNTESETTENPTLSAFDRLMASGGRLSIYDEKEVA